MSTTAFPKSFALLAGCFGIICGGCETGDVEETDVSEEALHPADWETGLERLARLRALRPILNCVERRDGRKGLAHFGYENGSNAAIPNPVGPLNSFRPGHPDRGQPTTFEPGQHHDVAQVEFGGRNPLIIWQLGWRADLAFYRSPDCATEPGWLCNASGQACYLPACGDGRVDSYTDRDGASHVEACDDGNAQPGDGCSAGCEKELGWTCASPGQACQAMCGNGLVDSDTSQDGASYVEACDDGNRQQGDGCAADCRSIDPGWLCEAPGLPCREPRCGDGRVDGLYMDRNGVQHVERCDDGNTLSDDGCSATCDWDLWWICDPSGQPCVRMCGNGRIDEYPYAWNEPGPTPIEPCDDGNTQAGDGCVANCSLIEPGWLCETPGLPCREPRCGDGRVESYVDRNGVSQAETCDDGNPLAGDGCSAACVRTLGWTCETPGQPCHSISGSCMSDLECPIEFLISKPALTSETNPSVAWGSNSALAVWEDSRGVYGARIRVSDGTILDPNGIAISSTQGGSPSVAFDGTNFLVGWKQTGLRVARIRESDGMLLDGPPESGGVVVVAVADFAIDSFSLAFAPEDGNYLVAWSGMCSPLPGSTGVCSRPGRAIIEGGWFMTAGQRVRAGDLALLDGSPDIGGASISFEHYAWGVAAQGGRSGFLTAWQSVTGVSSSLSAAHIARLQTLTMSLPGSQSFPVSYSPPSIGFDGERIFLVTWANPGTMNLQGWRSDGSTTLDSSPLRISTSASGPLGTDAVYDGTNFLVAWSDSRGGTYLARIRPSDGLLLDGTPEQAGFQVSTTGGAVVAAGPSGRAIVLESRRASDLGVDATRLVAKLIDTE